MVDTLPCCRACFGHMSILHIKTSRKTCIPIGIFLNDVGVHWPSIALIVGHERCKWGSATWWSNSAVSTTSSATNGRQATLCALMPHIVCEWCVWVAFACKCSAGAYTTSLAAVLSMCGAVRYEQGDGWDVKSNNMWLLVAGIVLCAKCVRIMTVVTLQPSYLIGLGSWNGGNCIPATQYLWSFKLPKGFSSLRSTLN